MPIYDYVCSNCGVKTEFIHGIDAPAPKFCPACGAEGTLRKTFATPAVHFKGSGWAKKDRSSSSGARAKAGAGASSSDSGDSGDGKTETAAKTTASDGADSGASKSKTGSGSSPSDD